MFLSTVKSFWFCGPQQYFIINQFKEMALKILVWHLQNSELDHIGASNIYSFQGEFDITCIHWRRKPPKDLFKMRDDTVWVTRVILIKIY